jgi:Tfp pilus assembly protein PilN
VIEINLLPDAPGSRKARGASARPAVFRSLRRAPGGFWTKGLGAVAMLIVLGTGWSLWSTASAMERLEARLEQELADSAAHASTISLVTSLRATQDTIRQKIEVIRRVDTRRYVWPRVLDEVSRATPPQSWLTRMVSTELPDSLGGPRFTLEGAAGTTESLTRFMKSLEASPYIHEVGLVTTEQVVTESGSFHRFTLEARYRNPDSHPTEPVALGTTRETPQEHGLSSH